MKKPSTYLFLYALLVLIGGIIGYATKGSFGSLIAGGIFAFLIGVAAWQMRKGSPTAYWAGVALVTFLGAFFSYRLYLTGSFMPAGLMIICSLVALLILRPYCHLRDRCMKIC